MLAPLATDRKLDMASKIDYDAGNQKFKTLTRKSRSRDGVQRVGKCCKADTHDVTEWPCESCAERVIAPD